MHISPSDLFCWVQRKWKVRSLGLGFEGTRMFTLIPVVQFLFWLVGYAISQADQYRPLSSESWRPEILEHRLLAPCAMRSHKLEAQGENHYRSNRQTDQQCWLERASLWDRIPGWEALGAQ